MASIFTHSLVGLTLGTLGSQEQQQSKKFWLTMALLPIIPDLDYVGFISRIPYESLWGHRGLSHSIIFSFFSALLAAVYLHRRLKASKFLRSLILCFASIFSHPLLDALTNGGLGVAFYAPYNTVRYFFPWRPINVSPMGIGFFSERGLLVIISELFWVWTPCLFFLATLLCLRRRSRVIPAKSTTNQ